MSVTISGVAANLWLDNFGALFPGTTGKLRIYTGTSPGAGNSATGTLLVDITLPASPWNGATSRTISKNGTWSTASATASGEAGYYRLSNSAAGSNHVDGTVTVTGGGGDLTLDTVDIVAGQPVTINTFTYSI